MSCLYILHDFSHVRHPAYFGFFLWSLGTQIVLGNPICLAAFYKILYQFFTDRILYSPQRALDSGYIDWGVFRYEERTLVQFFSPDYVQYRAKTWSGFFGIE